MPPSAVERIILWLYRLFDVNTLTPLASLSSSSGSSRTQLGHDLNPEAGPSRHGHCTDKDASIGQERQTAEPQHKPGLSKKLNEALQRAGSVRRSGRSASAEDLLERLEDRCSPQHVRSRSSPTAEKLDQVAWNCISGDFDTDWTRNV